MAARKATGIVHSNHHDGTQYLTFGASSVSRICRRTHHSVGLWTRERHHHGLEVALPIVAYLHISEVSRGHGGHPSPART